MRPSSEVHRVKRGGSWREPAALLAATLSLNLGATLARARVYGEKIIISSVTEPCGLREAQEYVGVTLYVNSVGVVRWSSKGPIGNCSPSPNTRRASTSPDNKFECQSVALQSKNGSKGD